MQILYVAHWLAPWLILIMGMYTLVKFVRGYMNESAFTDADRRLMSVFGGLMDLQAATGLIFYAWSGFTTAGFPVHRFFHGIIMFAAVVLPHFSARWKNADDSTRFINNFYLLLASFLLMLLGISLIPNAAGR